MVNIYCASKILTCKCFKIFDGICRSVFGQLDTVDIELARSSSFRPNREGKDLNGLPYIIKTSFEHLASFQKKVNKNMETQFVQY